LSDFEKIFLKYFFTTKLRRNREEFFKLDKWQQGTGIDYFSEGLLDWAIGFPAVLPPVMKQFVLPRFFGGSGFGVRDNDWNKICKQF
jgi:hypothetical protein